ncbi:glycosyl hydrolase [Bacteroidota bacterium]
MEKSVKNSMSKVCIVFFALFFIYGSDAIFAQKKTKLSKYTFGEIQARQIGPATMSGRITSIDAQDTDPNVVYIGSAGGGVWKSKNAGTTFEPIFDKHNQCIGCISIDQNHPDTVWVGTGEVWTRNSVSVGDGIYRTTDGGEKWRNMGLKDTERIGRIIIDPNDPNTLYVAALGHLWNANEDRGVYKTTDGGKNWEKILYVDENTGCADLTMDPDNPNVLLAAMWDFRRKPYFFRSGGPGSGLYKTSDAGKTWTKIEEPFPKTTIGRIAVAFSPVDPNIVWTVVESEKTGLFKSYDKGDTWELLTQNPVIATRPFYFALLVPDPVDTNRLYKPEFTLRVSDDGGETFSVPFVGGGNVHSDLHALWISPIDNRFMYCGTDGGLYISHDRGNTWKFCRNLPISTFYHVTVDNRKPYWVYGGLQDNGSWMSLSKDHSGIHNKNWDYLGYGDGFNAFRDNTDPNILYFQSQGGNIQKRFEDTWGSKDIKPYADNKIDELRFNWNTPIIQSKNNNTLYVGAQYLFKSNDAGDSWERISPDLTTNNTEKLNQEETGGLTIDNSTAENHCTIFAIAESPLDENIIWVGTDDGNLQLTRDGGNAWTNVGLNIKDIPPTTWCSSIEPGKFEKGVAYVTFDGHKQGDKTPYVFVTEDYGQTWKSLVTKDIPIYCHVIREDFVNPDLLFLGTEYGLFVSINKGESWIPFTGNVPKVSIRDMVFQERESDLVLATHGRGIIIIDDLTPIRQLNEELIENDFAFLETKPYKIWYNRFKLKSAGDDSYVGNNPNSSLNITYYLKKRHIFGDMYVEVYDLEGNKLASLPAGIRKGVNMVPWYMRMKPPKVAVSAQLLGQAMVGPEFPPGEYKVKVIKNEEVYETNVKVISDPDSPHSVADRELRFEIIMKAYYLLEDLAYIDYKMKEVRDKAKEISESENIKASLKKKLLALYDQMDEMRKELLATKEGRITGEKRIRERIGNIYSNVMGYQGRPSDSQIERLDYLETISLKFDEKVDNSIDMELSKINKELVKAQLDKITLKTKEAFMEEGK